MHAYLLHLLWISCFKYFLMLFHVFSFFETVKRTRAAVKNIRIVAHDMLPAYCRCAKAKIIFLSVAFFKRFGVKHPDPADHRPFDIHAEPVCNRDLRIYPAAASFHKLCIAIQRISVWNRIFPAKNRNGAQCRIIGQRRHGRCRAAAVCAGGKLFQPVFCYDRIRVKQQHIVCSRLLHADIDISGKAQIAPVAQNQYMFLFQAFQISADPLVRTVVVNENQPVFFQICPLFHTFRARL